MAETKIEWAEHVFNPVRGCTAVSAGCRNCFAASVAYRFSGPGQAYEGLAYRKNGRAHWTGKIRLMPEKLEEPLRRKKPTRYFVNSMSDVFHDDVPFESICAILGIAQGCLQHDFLILTKRIERAHKVLADISNGLWHPRNPVKWPLPNVWLGVSVEDQATADERIPLLLDTPAAVRFVSYEPALGPVDWKPYFYRCTCGQKPDCVCKGLAFNWLIAGGESGPGARPAHPDWFRQARDQCVAAGVPFLFKQWGEYAPPEDMTPIVANGAFERERRAVCWEGEGTRQGTRCGFMWRVGKKAAGRLLDGREWDEYPVG